MGPDSQKITFENLDSPSHMKLLLQVIRTPELGKKHLHSLDKELDQKAYEELWQNPDKSIPPEIRNF